MVSSVELYSLPICVFSPRALSARRIRVEIDRSGWVNTTEGIEKESNFSRKLESQADAQLGGYQGGV